MGSVVVSRLILAFLRSIRNTTFFPAFTTPHTGIMLRHAARRHLRQRMFPVTLLLRNSQSGYVQTLVLTKDFRRNACQQILTREVKVTGEEEGRSPILVLSEDEDSWKKDALASG